MITKNIVRALVCFTLLFTTCLQAAPSLKDYGGLPDISRVSISPDGQRVAFYRIINDRKLVQVVSLADNKSIAKVDVSSIVPQDVYFLNNNQLLIRVAELKRVSGFLGKFDVSSAFLFDLPSKKIRQLLTPGDKILAGQQGLGDVVGITADKKYLLMPAYSDVDFQFPTPKYQLYKVGLNSKILKMADIGDYNIRDFFVDAEGEPLVRIEFDEKTDEYNVYTRHKNNWDKIFSEKTPIRYKAFQGLSEDFKNLIFIETDQDSQRESVFSMSLADGKITGPLYLKPNSDVQGLIVDIQRVVRGVEYSGFTPSYYFFNSELNARFQAIAENFPEHSVYLESYSPDWKHLVVNVSGSLIADDYYLASAGKEIAFLASGRPAISETDINPIGKVTFTARDGLKIPTLITIPRSKIDSMKNLPAVIYPHGGPASYDRIGFDFIAQALSAQGYMVIQPQFRGSTGFGQAHYTAGLGEWGKKMQDDLSDAVSFFANKGFIDPQRVCIVGGSYGGYAALAGGAFTPDLYKCVVSINGIGDLNDMLSWDKGRNGSTSEVAAYMELQFGKNDQGKKGMHDVSPLYFADHFKAPVLLIHSENDKRVPIRQSKDMLAALHKAKKEATFIELKGDNHHLREGDTRIEAVEETIKFVNHYLKP